jgi:hypothetical protein
MEGYVSTARLGQLRDRLVAVLNEVEAILEAPELVDRRRTPDPRQRPDGAVKPTYRIGPGEESYATLVWRYMPADRSFSLDEAVATIRPMVIDPAERFRDGMRQGLQRDARFREIRHDDGTLYFRRVAKEADGRLGIDEGSGL